MDAYKLLHSTLNPDGSLTRNYPFPSIPPTGYNNNNDPTQSETMATIDVLLNTTKNTWIRVYHPINLPTNTYHLLPVIIYFHGGGFVIFSAASLPFHESCVTMARDLPAIVLSVEYRLAPEHRLPSAYDDAVDAMLWLKQQALHGEHRFASCADFTKCFIMGCSSGGNIAYQAGLKALNLDLEPVKINGLILNIPFFGGMERSESESKYVNDPILPLTAADLMWELSLPLGADRGHEYCNPMLEGGKYLEIGRLPKCFVNGYNGDPLVDRQKEFVKMLKGHGLTVESHFFDGGYHAVELFDPEKAQMLLTALKDFMYSCITGVSDVMSTSLGG